MDLSTTQIDLGANQTVRPTAVHLVGPSQQFDRSFVAGERKENNGPLERTLQVRFHFLGNALRAGEASRRAAVRIRDASTYSSERR